MVDYLVELCTEFILLCTVVQASPSASLAHAIYTTDEQCSASHSGSRPPWLSFGLKMMKHPVYFSLFPQHMCITKVDIETQFSEGIPVSTVLGATPPIKQRNSENTQLKLRNVSSRTRMPANHTLEMISCSQILLFPVSTAKHNLNT